MNQYSVVIAVSLVGFLLLAVLLLTPVYLFLKREEKSSEAWTDEEIAKRLREKHSASNGAHPEQEEKGA